eukprot:jgi/Botrbrau1/5154/Bobra.0172s0026.1
MVMGPRIFFLVICLLFREGDASGEAQNSVSPDSTASAARTQTGAVSPPPPSGPTQRPPPRASPSPPPTPQPPPPTVCFAAGQTVFPLSAPCWSCVGDYCDLYGASARLGAVGTTSNLTTRLLTPGGGVYRLKYRLQLAEGGPGSWRSVISSTDGSFPPIILESFDNLFDYNWVPMRELAFNIPSRTRAIDLTFVARHDTDYWYVDSATVLIGFPSPPSSPRPPPPLPPPPPAPGTPCFTAGVTPVQLRFSFDCWSCNPSFQCYMYYGWAGISGVGNLSTTVIIPRGGTYRLNYTLYNGQISANNSFRAVVSSVNNAFAPIVLDNITDATPSQQVFRRLIDFNVPAGASAFVLTLAATQEGSSWQLEDPSVLLVTSSPPPAPPALPGPPPPVPVCYTASAPLSFQITDYPCWTCLGFNCTDNYIDVTGGTAIATTNIAIPTPGNYQLSYLLRTEADIPNSWRVVVRSANGSF